MWAIQAAFSMEKPGSHHKPNYVGAREYMYSKAMIKFGKGRKGRRMCCFHVERDERFELKYFVDMKRKEKNIIYIYILL